MFGYKLVDVAGRRFKMAEPEKVLLDYLYLNTDVQSTDDFESLRINQPELSTLLNGRKLTNYLALFEDNALEKRVNTFKDVFMF